MRCISHLILSIIFPCSAAFFVNPNFQLYGQWRTTTKKSSPSSSGHDNNRTHKHVTWVSSTFDNACNDETPRSFSIDEFISSLQERNEKPTSSKGAGLHSGGDTVNGEVVTKPETFLTTMIINTTNFLHEEGTKKKQNGKSHSETWYRRLHELREFKMKHGHSNVPAKYADNPKLSNWISHQRTLYRYMKEGKRTTLNEVRVKLLEEEGFVWDLFDAAWMEQYDALRRFKQEFGHCLVPVNAPQKDREMRKLGFWVEKQRQNYRELEQGLSSSLAEERVNLLNELGFIWDAQDALWETRLNELKQFKAENGHCNVCDQYEKNLPLGRWVTTQRREFRNMKKGMPSHLTKDRIDKLEKEGFVWCPHEAAWEQQYERLVQYKAIHGDCNVPRNATYGSLGIWVRNQRAENRLLWKKERGHMTEDRYRSLMQLGFSWYVRPIKLSWDERYEELVQYKSWHGNCDVPIDCLSNPGLGKWLRVQRQNYKLLQKGKPSSLTQERAIQLSNLGVKL